MRLSVCERERDTVCVRMCVVAHAGVHVRVCVCAHTHVCTARLRGTVVCSRRSRTTTVGVRPAVRTTVLARQHHAGARRWQQPRAAATHLLDCVVTQGEARPGATRCAPARASGELLDASPRRVLGKI